MIGPATVTVLTICAGLLDYINNFPKQSLIFECTDQDVLGQHHRAGHGQRHGAAVLRGADHGRGAGGGGAARARPRRAARARGLPRHARARARAAARPPAPPRPHRRQYVAKILKIFHLLEFRVAGPRERLVLK